MAFGNETQRVLQQFHELLPEGSKSKARVEEDVRKLRHAEVEGVGVQDDKAYEILSVLYDHTPSKAVKS